MVQFWDWCSGAFVNVKVNKLLFVVYKEIFGASEVVTNPDQRLCLIAECFIGSY